MPVNRVLASVAVADVDAALPWYEQLFGRTADALPMDGLAEWHVPSGGVVQLVASAERAGRSLLTLELDDLERELAVMRERGLDVGALDDTTSDKVLIATTTDPKGNAIETTNSPFPRPHLQGRSLPDPYCAPYCAGRWRRRFPARSRIAGKASSRVRRMRPAQRRGRVPVSWPSSGRAG
jgi:predicted enzyme related to lactoylglutathione lyase